jgi:alpha-L-fucosidase
MNNQHDYQGMTGFLPEDSLKERMKKAAHVAPGKEQLRWMEKEMTAFLHFGMNTFTGRQWGNGQETLADYAPSALDPEQWVRVCAEAGLKHIICTLKHHDGFCLWHTGTTDFSVEHTACPTDVAKALSDACRKYGVGFGVYLSPWDMHQREAGIWPTEAYNDLFMRQLEELLTKYGPVEEVWFDGACGDYPIWQKVPCYQPEKWYEMIHRLQPDAVYRMYDPYFFASEEDWESLKRGGRKLEWSAKAVRWVGNEEGRSRENEWSVQPVCERMIARNATWPDLGNIRYYPQAAGAVWYPVEVNTTILNQWFWNPGTSKVKSLGQLKETYYQSVGNNGELLLNLSPDRTGQIPEDQVSRLMEFRRWIDSVFSDNLATGATVKEAGAAEDSGSSAAILTENQEEYWEGKTDWDSETDTVSFDIQLPEERTFDQAMLREHVRDGQRIAGWSLSVWKDGMFREAARKEAAGRKCIRRFDTVRTDRLRLTIHKSYDTPQISGFGLFFSGGQETAENEAITDLTGYACAGRPENAISGVFYRFYRGGRQSAAFDPEAEQALKEGWLEKPEPDGLPGREDFHAELAGWLQVREKGVYRFELTSVDGAMFYLADRLCLDNDEPHERRNVSAKLYLDKGYYPYRILYTSFRGRADFALNPDADREKGTEKRICLL